jgi:hypothetical protein
MKQIHFMILTALFFSSAQASQVISSVGTSAIYGTDNREFISSKTDKKIKELSSSVAMIVQKELVTSRWPISQISADLLSDKKNLNLCVDQKFASHHSLNSCTGLLIAPDLVASAGHCFMSEDDCRNKSIIFEVLEKNENEAGYKILKKQVYECKEIVKSAFDDSYNDFAVIRLKKRIFDRTPLRLRRNGEISTTDKVFMIGHPLGLPQVLTSIAKVIETSEVHFFKATLDSFEGNSGSPVFNARTLEVEGILVRGEDDFVQTDEAQCLKYKTFEEASGKGESVTKIRDLLQ